MKYASTLSIMLALVLVSTGHASKKDKIELKEKQDRLELIKAEIEEVRDSFETEAARRYTLKQKGVDQRELDKQEFEQLRETQERAAGDLARVKEECLSREQLAADERKATETAKEEWSSLKSSLSEVLKKEADAVLEAFPLDREIRREDLEWVRADYASKQDPSQGWDDFVAYAQKDLGKGLSVGIISGDALPDQGGPIKLTLARFGNIFALGIDPAGHAYLVRQTGRLGPDKYSVEHVGSPDYSN